jgi:hypothetical protein
MTTKRPITSFLDVLEPSYYSPVSSEHGLVFTDIRGSTSAIEAGRYKDINTVGAATIIAILNACGRERLPFVFGGDGASMVIPPHHLEATKRALLGCKKMAREAFGFELRCGIIPVAELTASGVKLEMADYEIVPGLRISVFRGGAMSRADQWIKDAVLSKNYELSLPDDALAPDADFTGLECRWKPIPSQRGLIVSLIIKFEKGQAGSDSRDLIEKIATAAHWNQGTPPLKRAQLRLARTVSELMSESRVHQSGSPLWLVRLRALAVMLLSNVGKGIVALRLRRLLPVRWLPDLRRYFDAVLTQVDDRKFDDVLRTVIDCTPQGWSTLESELMRIQDQGRIRYGAHVSREMLMTCMVFDRELQHLHFVDGANGGYALAARKLKAK